MTTAFEVMLVLGAVCSWVFIARYMTAYRWWETEFGPHIIAWSSIVGGFYTYYAVVVIWPQLPGRALIRLVLFALMTVAIIWRLAMFERVRWQSRKGDR